MAKRFAKTTAPRRKAGAAGRKAAGNRRAPAPQPWVKALQSRHGNSAVAASLEHEARRAGESARLGSAPPARSLAARREPARAPAPAIVACEPGAPVPDAVRRRAEAALGRDFSDVRVHADAEAHSLARAFGARAFTSGNSIWLGRGQSALDASLMTHELCHVVQQSRPFVEGHGVAPAVQLEEDPNVGQSSVAPAATGSEAELLSTPDLDRLTSAQLRDRFVRLGEALKRYDKSTTAEDENIRRFLLEEMNRVAAVVEQRRNGAFSPATIQAMRDYFVRNEAAWRVNRKRADSCIVSLNHGLQLALGRDQKTSVETIEDSMAQVQKAGHVSQFRTVELETEAYNRKKAAGQPVPELDAVVHGGSVKPFALHESVYDVILAMTGADRGLLLFTMSIASGYHSVTVIVDKTDPATPKVSWSDEVIHPADRSAGGSLELSRDAFDLRVIQESQNAWKVRKRLQDEDARKPEAERRWKNNPNRDKAYLTQIIRLWRISPL